MLNPPWLYNKSQDNLIYLPLTQKIVLLAKHFTKYLIISLIFPKDKSMGNYHYNINKSKIYIYFTINVLNLIFTNVFTIKSQ